MARLIEKRARDPNLRGVTEVPLPQCVDEVSGAAGSVDRLLHELQVHQVELELSNESLREAQLALEESRDRYVRLYEFAPVGYFTLTADGLISEFNLAGAKLLARARQDLVSMRFASFVPREEQDRWGQWFSRLREQAEPVSTEIALRRGDGVIIHGRVDCVRQTSSAGELSVLMALTDITERKVVENETERHRLELEGLVASRTAELAQARDAAQAASRAKGDFLANMSHEIRTPMNAIVGFTYLLRHAEPRPEQAKRLDLIADAAAHLLSIINDILDISKIEAGKLVVERTPFSLHALLDDVRSLIVDQASAKGVLVKVDPGNVPLGLLGDESRLRQALLNYASNAVKFTERGSITLRAVRRSNGGDDLQVRFEVVDTGIGVSPEYMPNLFQAFEQADNSIRRQYGGTGLGLAITRQLAALMGGEAGADSERGKGSTFWFTARLGRSDDHMPASADNRPRDSASELRRRFAGAQVLLAEDNAANRELTVELLLRAGLAVDVALDGLQAVEQARTNTYDLILMDVQMPGLYGQDATRIIRRLPGMASTPILALTADASPANRRECLEAGMDEFVAKPLDPEALYALLLSWLPTSPIQHAVLLSVQPEQQH